MNYTSPSEEPDVGAILDNIQFKIPVGSLAKTYEMRRVLRLRVQERRQFVFHLHEQGAALPVEGPPD